MRADTVRDWLQHTAAVEAINHDALRRRAIQRVTTPALKVALHELAVSIERAAFWRDMALGALDEMAQQFPDDQLPDDTNV